MKKLLFVSYCILVGNILLQPIKIVGQTIGDNCEQSSAKLVGVRTLFKDIDSEQKIILIANLGRKERNSFLNKRRLFSVTAYLQMMKVEKNRIVTANTDKSTGLGKVEIYIQGRLVEIIYARRDADIPVGKCDNDYEDNKRFQLPKKMKWSNNESDFLLFKQ